MMDRFLVTRFRQRGPIRYKLPKGVDCRVCGKLQGSCPDGHFARRDGGSCAASRSLVHATHVPQLTKLFEVARRIDGSSSKRTRTRYASWRANRRAAGHVFWMIKSVELLKRLQHVAKATVFHQKSSQQKHTYFSLASVNLYASSSKNPCTRRPRSRSRRADHYSCF